MQVKLWGSLPLGPAMCHGKLRQPRHGHPHQQRKDAAIGGEEPSTALTSVMPPFQQWFIVCSIRDLQRKQGCVFRVGFPGECPRAPIHAPTYIQVCWLGLSFQQPGTKDNNPAWVFCCQSSPMFGAAVWFALSKWIALSSNTPYFLYPTQMLSFVFKHPTFGLACPMTVCHTFHNERDGGQTITETNNCMILLVRLWSKWNGIPDRQGSSHDA